MKVLKFGGSSVANAENIKKVAEIVLANHQSNAQLVVVSALSGITDELIAIGQMAAKGNEEYKDILINIEKRHLDTTRELLPVTAQSSLLSLIKQYCNELEDICESVFRLQELSARTKDRIISFGELLSSKIIAAYLKTVISSTEWLDSRELIKTNSFFGAAIVDFETTNKLIANKINDYAASVFLAPGFIASNNEDQSTTLGRGGSDYTAAIYAAALQAPVLEIWTDVSGMMTADPRLVPNAKPIPHISYLEAMELSHFGAKVIYPPTIQPVMAKKIPIWIKNTFAPLDYGTLIEAEYTNGGNRISGFSSIGKVALLSLEGSGMVGIPGFSRRLFEALASRHVNVILITQSSSEHSISVAINQTDAEDAKQVVDNSFEVEIANGKLEPLVVETNLSIIAVVGDKMKNHSGISGGMFSALGRNGINIRAIAQGSSERNISAVISSTDVKKALNVLHEAFFETVYKQLNLFVTGLGNVGSKLFDQLAGQQAYLVQHHKIQLRVVGMANSRKMIFDEDGIDLTNWRQLLENGQESNLQSFVQNTISRNLRNSVFVDITASADVAEVYNQLLIKSISVVACNKIAASSPYNNYQNLKALSAEYNAQFLFETNVGAGLPIIGTLNDLVKSGDKINSIEAVLSGTLNFVFNQYDGSQSFSKVVRQAQNEGYTEPDPRLDLSGVDVMRKIMILAREAGNPLEMSDIENIGFLPESCMSGSVEDFYTEMEKHEAHFLALYNKVAAENCKLKFVASFKQGKASVGLQHISPSHNLYHLYGKDNIVLFYTSRYPDQPLVIKGAGAGADVTASGVFADIMRVSI